MSNTRIRYKKVDSTLLKSVRNFQVENKSLSVLLDTEKMKYLISDENTRMSIDSGGKTKNLAVLKIQAKRALKNLGVDFGDETRNRGTEDNSEVSSGSADTLSN